ncbi:hypothetical protein ACLK17_03765 [Escherichia coli]
MPVQGLELASWIEARLGRRPLWCGDTGPEVVPAHHLVHGRRAKFYGSRRAFGVIVSTGEVSEQTIHKDREQGFV